MKSYQIQRSVKYSMFMEWKVSKPALVARDAEVAMIVTILLIRMSFSASFSAAPQYSTLWTK
jgi:hypothetical protein